jgi:hypothetical protein
MLILYPATLQNHLLVVTGVLYAYVCAHVYMYLCMVWVYVGAILKASYT